MATNQSSIIPYKNRKLINSRCVEVYRNLGMASKEIWSIRQGGLVVAHADEVYLEDCQFVVSIAGNIRVRKNKAKNVHATIRGFLCKQFVGKTPEEQIVYAPYTMKTFENTDGKRVYFRKYVSFREKRVESWH